MTSAESIIILLLALIAWFLYQIAKQLSFLTGKRVKLSIFGRQQLPTKFKSKPNPKPQEDPHEKLPN